MVRIVKLPEIREKLSQQGADPVGSTPEEFAARGIGKDSEQTLLSIHAKISDLQFGRAREQALVARKKIARVQQR